MCTPNVGSHGRWQMRWVSRPRPLSCHVQRFRRRAGKMEVHVERTEPPPQVWSGWFLTDRLATATLGLCLQHSPFLVVLRPVLILGAGEAAAPARAWGQKGVENISLSCARQSGLEMFRPLHCRAACPSLTDLFQKLGVDNMWGQSWRTHGSVDANRSGLRSPGSTETPFLLLDD